MATKNYTSEDIKTFVGLEKVRKFATMYIGSTDADGLFLILRELMDNAIDEFTAGRAKNLKVYIPTKKDDGYYYAVDDGTGVPQGVQKIEVEVSGKTVTSKMQTMQAVFGELHTSGKHSDAYGASIGVHGVGSKGTNALSTVFEVFTYFKKKWYYIRFEKGKLAQEVKRIKSPPKDTPFGVIKKGTIIRYKPDFSLFSAKSFPVSQAMEWAELTSYLNPGMTIEVMSGKTHSKFFSKNGTEDYLNMRLKELKAEPLGKMFTFSSELCDVGVYFTTYDGNGLRGFTNGLHNAEGGTHLNAVQSVMYEVVKTYAKKRQEFTAHEFKEGIVGLVNAKLSGAKFSSQAKVRLTDERTGEPLKDLLRKPVTEFFKANKKLAEQICERCAKLKELKTKFTASKTVLRRINQVKRQGLPAKFSPAHPSTKPKDRELFLVEGDSAAGGLKSVRHKHQAILPLKGKIANALKQAKVLESEEVINILVAAGIDINAKDPYGKLSTGKIICLADPDPDGNHINTLLLTLFYKYAPELIERGYVYVVNAPEFYAHVKNKLYTGDTLSEIRKKLEQDKAKNATIHHIKGWGEVDTEELLHFALNEDTRNLVQIEMGDRTEYFEKLMNEDVEYRKGLLGI